MPAAAREVPCPVEPRSRSSTDLRPASSRAIASPITPPPMTITSCMLQFYMLVLAIVSVRSRKTFQQLVTLPDAAVPLAEAALIMACEEYPQLELSPYLDMLDQIAGVAQEKTSPSDTPRETVQKINSVLFD